MRLRDLVADVIDAFRRGPDPAVYGVEFEAYGGFEPESRFVPSYKIEDRNGDLCVVFGGKSGLVFREQDIRERVLRRNEVGVDSSVSIAAYNDLMRMKVARAPA